MKDEDTKERFIELRARGFSFDKIAGEIDVSKPVLIAWSRELSKQIRNRKALEIEALNEKYFLTYQAEVSLFGEQLENIKQELAVRDFKDVPTDKLLTLLLTLHEKLVTKKVEPVIRTEQELENFSEEIERIKEELHSVATTWK